MSSHLEDQFSNQWLISFPRLPFLREYSLPIWGAWAAYQQQQGLRSRRPPAYRADFAWPAALVAVEINGGIWRPGGHSTGRGITRDVTKAALAQLSGWSLISLTESHINDGTPYWLQLIADLIVERTTVFWGSNASAHRIGGDQSLARESLPDPDDAQARAVSRDTRRTRASRHRVDLRRTLADLRRGATSDLQRERDISDAMGALHQCSREAARNPCQ